jgi:flavodoxin I
MPDIGIFFASSTGNCETIARMVANHFSDSHPGIHDVMHTEGNSVQLYRNLIFGIPTWGKYQMHEDWRDFLTTLPAASLKGKKIALYGSADQRMYPDNFADSLGMLYEWLIKQNIEVVGQWSVKGYAFRQSFALRDGNFVGLVLDEEVQSHLTLQRVADWTNKLKTEFDL